MLGRRVVWYGLEGPDMEIFLYDGRQTTQLTDNNYDEWSPQIDGRRVVWNGRDGNDRDIYLYDRREIIQLTDNDYDDLYPQIDGRHVVWQVYDGNDWEIFYYDIKKGITTQVTRNNDEDESPHVSRNGIVWRRGREGEPEAEIHYSPIPNIWR